MEVIDGAQFESPKQAVELKEPALKLMTVLEANRDPALSVKVIEWLQHKPLAELVKQDDIARPFEALWARHEKAIACRYQCIHARGLRKGDDRQAAIHRLEHDRREGILARGQRENIRASIIEVSFLHEARKQEMRRFA